MSVFTLDDRDPAFAYTGFWGQMGDMNLDFAGTATWTNLSTSTAVVTFTGVQITVFGAIAQIGDGAAPTTFYSLDNVPTKQAFTAVQLPQAQFHQQFFQSEILTPGKHTLTIQYLANEGKFILDYVQIQAAQTSPSQASTTATPSSQTATTTVTATTATTASASPVKATNGSSTAPTSATGSITQSSTTTPALPTTPISSDTSPTLGPSTTAELATTPAGSTSSPTTPASSLVEHRTHNNAPTIGGVIGGIVLVAIVIIGVIIWRKRRNRAFSTTLPISSDNVVPFHPQPIQEDNMTNSTYFATTESKSTAQLLSLPPPAYE